MIITEFIKGIFSLEICPREGLGIGELMIKSDIDLAKELLVKEHLNICIVRDGLVVFKSKNRGIQPMYKAVTDCLDQLENASVADRVIGRAAALLAIYSKVSNVYSDVISDNAVDLLQAHDIHVSHKVQVTNIKNRDKTDLCPIEKLSSTITDTDYDKLLDKIRLFLISISAL